MDNELEKAELIHLLSVALGEGMRYYRMMVTYSQIRLSDDVRLPCPRFHIFMGIHLIRRDGS